MSEVAGPENQRRNNRNMGWTTSRGQATRGRRECLGTVSVGRHSLAALACLWDGLAGDGRGPGPRLAVKARLAAPRRRRSGSTSG
jgi:hypothetical protein